MKLEIARRESEQKPAKVLVVPDPHVRPGQSMERFRALARLVIKERPTHVVWIGDLWDMPSLNRHNGAKSRGGSGPNALHGCRTFGQDIAAGREAIRAFEDVISKWNARQSRSGRPDKIVRFVRIFCIGNHEYMVEEAGIEIAEFRDTINLENHIGAFLRGHGYHVIPFLHAAVINGVHFSHYFKSGSMKNPVQIGNAIRQIGRSAVWGHTHIVGYAERQVPTGDWDKFLCCGTFMDENTLQYHHGASSGVVILDDVMDGDFTHSFVSLRRLLEVEKPSVLSIAA